MLAGKEIEDEVYLDGDEIAEASSAFRHVTCGYLSLVGSPSTFPHGLVNNDISYSFSSDILGEDSLGPASRYIK